MVEIFDYKVGENNQPITKTPDLGDSDETLSAVQQVAKVTTAIFIILLGALIEYSDHTDAFVLFLGLFTGFAKLCLSVYLFTCYTNPEFCDQQESWKEMYKIIPFEIIYAINRSCMYIQLVYLVKWVNNSNVMTVWGIRVFFTGLILAWKENYFANYYNDPKYFYLGKFIVQVVPAFVIIALSILQKRYCSMDPLDRDLIINEQCINLMAHFSLKNITDVMIKSDFEKYLDEKLNGKQNRKLR